MEYYSGIFYIVTKTISRNIGMKNKLKIFAPERILRTLYCTLVLPMSITEF